VEFAFREDMGAEAHSFMGAAARRRPCGRRKGALLAGMLLLGALAGEPGAHGEPEPGLDSVDAAERVCWRAGEDFARCVEGDGEDAETPAVNMESPRCQELRSWYYLCVRVTARFLPIFVALRHGNHSNITHWVDRGIPLQFLRAFKLEEGQEEGRSPLPPHAAPEVGSMPPAAEPDGGRPSSHRAGETRDAGEADQAGHGDTHHDAGARSERAEKQRSYRGPRLFQRPRRPREIEHSRDAVLRAVGAAMPRHDARAESAAWHGLDTVYVLPAVAGPGPATCAILGWMRASSSAASRHLLNCSRARHPSEEKADGTQGRCRRRPGRESKLVVVVLDEEVAAAWQGFAQAEEAQSMHPHLLVVGPSAIQRLIAAEPLVAAAAGPCASAGQQQRRRQQQQQQQRRSRRRARGARGTTTRRGRRGGKAGVRAQYRRHHRHRARARGGRPKELYRSPERALSLYRALYKVLYRAADKTKTKDEERRKQTISRAIEKPALSLSCARALSEL